MREQLRPKFGVPQMGDERLSILGHIIKQVNGGRCHALEVGSYEGGSALFTSRIIAEYFEGGSVTCVDPWVKYLDASSGVAEQMNRDLETEEVFRRFLSNIKLAPAACPIMYHIGNLTSFAWNPGMRYDLIMIDGSHKYMDVLKDLVLAEKMLKVGGLLCGDDLENQFDDMPEGVLYAEDLEYTGVFHPGVTRAVWEFFGRRIPCKQGVWGVRKAESGWEDIEL